MKAKQLVISVLMLANLCPGWSLAQERSPTAQQEAAGRREPPPQAYEDCKGKKAGDAVQHTTREGKVAATCADSPKGLVARPNQPGAADGRKP